MYLCNCEKLVMKDGSIVRRGQPVPEALEWAEHIVRANKRMGYIIDAPKTAATAPPASTVSEESETDSPAAGGSTDEVSSDSDGALRASGKRGKRR